MVRFLKFLHFSAFHFPKDYKNAVADANFQCLKFTYWAWITLKYTSLSEMVGPDPPRFDPSGLKYAKTLTILGQNGPKYLKGRKKSLSTGPLHLQKRGSIPVFGNNIIS